MAIQKPRKKKAFLEPEKEKGQREKTPQKVSAARFKAAAIEQKDNKGTQMKRGTVSGARIRPAGERSEFRTKKKRGGRTTPSSDGKIIAQKYREGEKDFPRRRKGAPIANNKGVTTATLGSLRDR